MNEYKVKNEDTSFSLSLHAPKSTYERHAHDGTNVNKKELDVVTDLAKEFLAFSGKEYKEYLSTITVSRASQIKAAVKFESTDINDFFEYGIFYRENNKKDTIIEIFTKGIREKAKKKMEEIDEMLRQKGEKVAELNGRLEYYVFDSSELLDKEKNRYTFFKNRGDMKNEF